jgi:hypothetical protein
VTDGQTLVDHIREDHRLLARAVLLDGEAARASFVAWRAMVDIDLVDAPSQRLLPLLARRLAELAPDDPLRGLIKGFYRHAWVKSQRLWRDAAEVVEALESAGIRTVLLKGAALFDSYGGDWGARPMYDVDVLVPVADAERAIDIVAARGWEPEQRQSEAWVRWRARPRRQGWGFTNGDGRLDLHWHVLSESIGARSDEGFWSRARRVDLAGTRTRALDPADLLVHLLVHGTVTFNAPAVQWVADSVRVLRQEASDPSFASRVARTAHEQAEQRSVARALDAIGILIERELVADALAQVERRRPTVVERLRRPGARWEPARQLARHAAGGEGLARGAVELAAERLDLGLTTHRAATLSYVASLRSPRVAARWRDRIGSFVRTPAGARVPALAGETELDFSRAEVLDRYGAIGWARTDERGSTTRGGEARLVLPLAPELATGGLELAVRLEPLADEVDVTVLANEVEIGCERVARGGTTVVARVPRDVVQRYDPLELSFRSARRVPPRSIRLRLCSLGIALRC